MVDTLVVSAVLDEGDLYEVGGFLAKHLAWLEEVGFPDARSEATQLLDLLLGANPGLLSQEARTKLGVAMESAGVSMPKIPKAP